MSCIALERAIRDGHLPALLRDLADGSASEQRLARVLRRDLPLLALHAELLFPCVYRLTYTDNSLISTLADWERGFERPWLRTLRAPAFPLDSGLVETYCGSGAPSFSLDGTSVGFLDERAWDRTSGASADPSVLARPVPIELHRRDVPWGSVRFTRRGQIHEIAVDSDTLFGCVAEGPDGSVITGGWFGDYEGRVARVDPDTGDVLWRSDLGADIGSVAVGGKLVSVSTSEQTMLLGLADGKPVPFGFLPSGRAAWSADCTLLAIAAPGELQIWDLAQAARSPLPSRRSHGFIHAEFSSDGKRLLTGNMLCDAVTGRILAELPVDGPGYLEGGPPRNGRRVLPDGFIEVSPFAIQRWNDTGKRVLHDRARGLNHRHQVRFSDNGEYIGVATEGTEISVLRTRDGASQGLYPARPEGFSVTNTGEVTDVRVPSSPYQLRVPAQSGLSEIVDRSGRLVAAIPSQAPLIGSPDGTRWAYRTEHYALEGMNYRKSEAG